MFWVPVAGAPGANGTSMPSYPVPMMAPGMVSVQQTPPMQSSTPPAFGTANSTATLSGDFSTAASAAGQNISAASFNLSSPTQVAASVKTPPASGSSSHVGGGGATHGAMVGGSHASELHPMYLISSTPSMPLGYTPMVTQSPYVPVSAMPMMQAGGFYPMAVYPPYANSPANTTATAASGDFSAVNSNAFFAAPAQFSPSLAAPSVGSGCFSAQPSGDFTSAVSYGTIPPAFSGTFTPPSASGAFYTEESLSRASLPLHVQQALGRAGKSGDAGRGYEAGVYYEGRVKRFNPVRGYGFLSATHKLLKLKDVRAGLAGAAAAKSTDGAKKAASAESNAETQSLPKSGSVGEKSDNTGKNSNNTSTAADASDIPLINVISVTGAETDPEIDMDDVVVIKGEEYVRKPVVMGDIFVHYHCLERTAAELESEQSGALVSLPAGARVQFKAEVFVPASLMEEARDSKQAAAMLNSIGIPVDDDPNLLAGAIATKKGWGYQAMNVVQLPARPRARTRRGMRGGRPRSAGNASTASHSSVNSARRSIASSQGRSEHEEGVNALAPCSGANLNIRVSLAGPQQPPPPSFESATAGMRYPVQPAGGVMYYPACTAGRLV